MNKEVAHQLAVIKARVRGLTIVDLDTPPEVPKRGSGEDDLFFLAWLEGWMSVSENPERMAEFWDAQAMPSTLRAECRHDEDGLRAWLSAARWACAALVVRDTLSRGSYERLTRPWRAHAAPIHLDHRG